MGLIPPTELGALLFFRLGFGSPGVFGLLSLLLPFLPGPSIVFTSGVSGVEVFSRLCKELWTDGGTEALSRPFRPVVEKWKSPGCPVMGFSSMYSSPYRRDNSNDSARSRELRYVLVLADSGDGFLAVGSESGIGVFSVLA
jgi:hypothetical protein